VFSWHSFFFAEARRKDENERPQTIQRQQISKMVLPTTSPARPDARVQHVGLQFGKGRDSIFDSLPQRENAWL
jgi:hypothetical protein